MDNDDDEDEEDDVRVAPCISEGVIESECWWCFCLLGPKQMCHAIFSRMLIIIACSNDNVMAAWYNLTVTSHQFLCSFGSRQCPLKSIHWTVLTKELLTWQFFIGRKWWMAIQHRRENHIEGELIESLNHHRTLSLRLWLNSTFYQHFIFSGKCHRLLYKKVLARFLFLRSVSQT